MNDEHEPKLSDQPPEPIPFICEVKVWNNGINQINEYIPADPDEVPPEDFTRFRTIVGVPMTLTRSDGAQMQQVKQVPMDVPGFTLEEVFANLPMVFEAATTKAVEESNAEIQQAEQAQKKSQSRIITAAQGRAAFDQSNGFARPNRAARRSMDSDKRRR